jgi:hypothetical protein
MKRSFTILQKGGMGEKRKDVGSGRVRQQHEVLSKIQTMKKED